MGRGLIGALEALKDWSEGQAQGYRQVQGDGSKGSRLHPEPAGPLGRTGSLSYTWLPGRGKRAAEMRAVGRAPWLASLLGAELG